MKSIVFFNNKGGVGKTTLLCNIASYLSLKMNKRVLVVDADPQCNATTYVLNESLIESLYTKNKRDTVYAFVESLRKGKGFVGDDVSVVKTLRFGFDIVPGDPKLALSEDLLASDWKTASSGDPRGLQTTFIFKDLSDRFGNYDYIFFDIGPSLGAINRSVLISADFFVMPMSVDIFSLMAISNISLSLKKWKKDLEKGLDEYEEEENTSFKIGRKDIEWTLQFCGYVSQQYTAKTSKGEREPVKAYEKIIKKFPQRIKDEIITNFSQLPDSVDYKLGLIPNLYSVVPMSQTANCPIFDLKSKDGVVGAHFSKVKEAESIFKEIAENLLVNVGGHQ
jgi:cellulose biosynthesis protein BcsQ